ncbi:uncharacterized protein LOC144444191 [Glandiceps talaboti]
MANTRDDSDFGTYSSGYFFDVRFPEQARETWDDCETKVRDIIGNKLNIDGANDDKEIGIERAYRMNKSAASQGPRPIIVKFSAYKSRSKILKAGRDLLKNSGLLVKEDFPPLIRSTRRKLRPFLQTALDGGKRAFLSFDKLVIEGERSCFDEATNDFRKL